MDLEETVTSLLSKNEQYRQENDQLKVIVGVVQENQELRARMQSFNHDSLEELPGIVSVYFYQQMAVSVQFGADRSVASIRIRADL